MLNVVLSPARVALQKLGRVLFDRPRRDLVP